MTGGALLRLLLAMTGGAHPPLGTRKAPESVVCAHYSSAFQYVKRRRKGECAPFQRFITNILTQTHVRSQYKFFRDRESKRKCYLIGITCPCRFTKSKPSNFFISFAHLRNSRSIALSGIFFMRRESKITYCD